MTRLDSRLLIVMLAAIILIAGSNLAVTILHYSQAQRRPTAEPEHPLGDSPTQPATTAESTSPDALTALERASERMSKALEDTETELAAVPLGDSSVTLFDVLSLMKDRDSVSGDTDTTSDELLLTAEQTAQIRATVDSLANWDSLDEPSKRECAQGVAQFWILMLTQAINGESTLADLQDDQTRQKMVLILKLMLLAEEDVDSGKAPPHNE